jgi:hypothetical protein
MLRKIAASSGFPALDKSSVDSIFLCPLPPPPPHSPPPLSSLLPHRQPLPCVRNKTRLKQKVDYLQKSKLWNTSFFGHVDDVQLHTFAEQWHFRTWKSMKNNKNDQLYKWT